MDSRATTLGIHKKLQRKNCKRNIVSDERNQLISGDYMKNNI